MPEEQTQRTRIRSRSAGHTSHFDLFFIILSSYV